MTARPLLASFGLSLLAASAWAGSISITTTQTASLDGETLVIEVAIGNSGDESAYAVTPVVRFGDREARGKRRESLAPNARIEDEVRLDVGALGPGTWAYVVAVDYTDANEYPFQAVQGGRLAIGEPPPAKIAVAEMTMGRLATTTGLTIEIKNLAGLERTASLRVMTPDGIEVDPPTQTVTLAPWKGQSVAATLTNRTALAGSRYPVFAAVEYDHEGVHHAVLGQGVVEIISAETIVDRFGGWLWVGAAALGAVFLLLVGARTLRG